MENKEYLQIVEKILENRKFNKLKEETHHHNSNRFMHSLEVSYKTYKVCKKLNLDYESATRAALLHDFFFDSEFQNKKERMLRHPVKALENSMKELTQITGQKPVVTKAKKSIAAFKLREGANVGCKVTLRADKMYDFAYKLFNVALPRVRDFRGVSENSFDGRGNYSMGIKEQLIFPEIEYDKVDKLRGMDIIFVTTAETDEEAKELLRLLGMPFKA